MPKQSRTALSEDVIRNIFREQLSDAVEQLRAILNTAQSHPANGSTYFENNTALKARVIAKCKDPINNPTLKFEEVKAGTGWGKSKLYDHDSRVENSDPARWRTKEISPFILGTLPTKE